jgi:hypothetical protein
MTEIFKGGTTSNLAFEYYERIKYKNFLQRTEQETGHQFINSLYEKSLYGFINRNYEVVAPTPSVKLFGEYAPEASGLDFVVNQFNHFREEFISKAAQGNLRIPDLISDVSPRVSFINYEEDYSFFAERLKNKLASTAAIADPQGNFLRNFENFVRFFHSEIFTTRFLNTPFTKTGFLLSSESSVYNTGLYVDLGQGQSVSLDQAKAEFIRDDGFLCFFELASKFGFFVDGNYPWRLAVNLNSDYTQRLLLNGREIPVQRFRDFYGDVFTNKPAYDDYDAIRSLFEFAYFEYSLRFDVTEVSITSRIAPELWLETLLLLKFKELSLLTSFERDSFFSTQLNKVLDIYRIHGLQSNSGALGKISQFTAEQLKNKISGQS